MGQWWHGPMAALDFETTAPDPTIARAVTATVIIDRGTVPECQSWLVDVEVEIPAEATAIHKITTEYARQYGEPAGKVISEITGLLVSLWEDQIPLVIFNAPYDLTVLDCERRRNGMAPLQRLRGEATPILDPLILDRTLDKYRRGSRKLDAVSRHYGVDLLAAHSSDADALAALQVARRMGLYYLELQRVGLLELFYQQQRWYAEWAANFEAYKRRQLRADGGTDEQVDAVHIGREWPIQLAHHTQPAALR